MRLTMCLLTWNELAGCENDVPHLPLDEFDEVYAIDGGSKDGTIEYLRGRGITVHPQIGHVQRRLPVRVPSLHDRRARLLSSQGQY